MEDKPLSPRWFVQGMALLAVAGFTIPIIAGVAGYLKQQLRQADQHSSYQRSHGNNYVQIINSIS